MKQSGFRAEGNLPPAPPCEELELRTNDGATLRALAWQPPDDAPFLGTCVLAHALFARKSSFGTASRPGLSGAFARAGLRAIAFDFRGHGGSVGPPGAPAPGYDDFVQRDLPSVVACARARCEGKPVIVVGHSMGGHAALASQGAGWLGADGIVTIAAGVWVEPLFASRVAWAPRLLALQAMAVAARGVGRFPARALRLSSDDGSGRLMRDLSRFATSGGWRSEDGNTDYLARLSDIDIPICAVASRGDRIICPPELAFSFARRCGPRVRCVALDQDDSGGPPPGHMELVTTSRAERSLTNAVLGVLGRPQPPQ